MSNDFINRRFYDRRRTASGGGGGTEFVEKELILLPTYDTFIYAGDSTVYPGTNERWTGVLPINQSASAGQTLAVGLVNPWLDANDFDPAPPPGGGQQGGGGGTVIVARTPTRTFLQYDLSGITSGSVIMSALLNLTTAGSSHWSEQSAFQLVQQQANEDITKNIWIAYNFDGAVQPLYPAYRAASWGADNPAFTWLKFVNGEYPFPNVDGYNPHPGRDHPWCLKAWYKWGARQFHLHMPFGRPYVTNENLPPGSQNFEHLAYQADAYLCAAEGFFDNGIFYNAPMPHLIVTFERIWKSLITGEQHCTNAEWESLTQWFNPADPIKVIVYNGCISGASGAEIENQYPRWTRLFDDDYDAALNRLKSSVQPFINCGMQIGLDALVLAPGSVPGQYISTDDLGARAQRGWWEFFNWLKATVGAENLYCEAHPEKRRNLITGNLDPSPYLGLNVMAAEDWSYFPASTAQTFHRMSELGSVRYLRATYWGSVGPKTRRINPYLSPARYFDLSEYGVLATDGEIRIDRLAQDIYFGTAFEHIYAARNLKDRFDQEGDKRQEFNTTKPGYIMNPLCLQEYPSSWGAAGTQRFIDRFPSMQHLKNYLDSYTSPPVLSS